MEAEEYDAVTVLECVGCGSGRVFEAGDWFVGDLDDWASVCWIASCVHYCDWYVDLVVVWTSLGSGYVDAVVADGLCWVLWYCKGVAGSSEDWR